LEVGSWTFRLIAFALFALCSRQASPPALRILFIGNSLTAANGLPAMVEALAASGGHRVACETVVFPGVSLEDHWARGDALRAIQRGGWSFVVLQQGPSALPESRVLLREYVRRFDRAIVQARARTAVYMVWPPAARRGDFDAVSDSYRLAAADVRGVLLPAADAWRAAWKDDPALELYGPDGFHPSALGTYLAAIVINARLVGALGNGVPAHLRSTDARFPSIDLTYNRAKLFERAAGRVTTY
jgi:hypothetical protein